MLQRHRIRSTSSTRLVAATKLRFMRLTAKWYVRGGIFTNAIAEHRQPGWVPQPLVDLTEFPSQSNTRV